MKLEKLLNVKTQNILTEAKFTLGRMLCYSKSAYYHRHPDHVVLFNANIYTEDEGKVWYGDLDLTIDGDRLAMVATEAQQTLYVLREMDGRFGKEIRSIAELKDVAVATYAP
jgi:hypothetical protein